MNIGYENEYSTDAMTGGPDKRRQLYYQLIQSMKKAESVDIIVSFLMESGVKMLLQELENTLKRGAKIRILTGNYLGITQPSALYLIKRKLGDRVDLRFYCEKGRSFHPKSYIFHYADHSELYIGSSNISRSALTSGIEWNYRFSSKKDPENYAEFFYTFEDLFENHSIIIDDKELKRYSQNWHRPAVAKDLDKYDFEQDTEDTKIKTMYEPRGAQIEALCALEDTRAEGAKKALIQAATGIGKTYLAAFDSKPYEKVLFVAHREEILKQAADSFRNVRNSEDYGFFTGDEKCTDKSVIFASVATLGKSEYLNEKYFAPDYFNYVVIDEFHHAVNDQYRKIVEYFKPQFLLGLTATPERMDGKNIYEICDYNVPYEISLKDGINKGMLVPFHYYGIYDETDYTKLHIVRGKYAEEELNKTYIGNAYRHDLIYKYYCKYGSKQALGFCCSRKHAEEMAKEFSRRGIPSAAVYSNANGEFSMDRTEAIEKLESGKIKVVFSVDMFNEGVDIPSVDMVMFLRPTESPIVFLQQLGRGLRRSKGKEYLNVLDFIGNYEKAGRVRYLLTGKSKAEKQTYSPADKTDYPDDCFVDFDMKLIDLFAEMDKKQQSLKDQIKKEYFRVKELLGKQPSRILEQVEEFSEDVRNFLQDSVDTLIEDKKLLPSQCIHEKSIESADLLCKTDRKSCKHYWKGQLTRAICFCEILGLNPEELSDIKISDKQDGYTIRIEFLCTEEKVSRCIQLLLEKALLKKTLKNESGIILLWNGQSSVYYTKTIRRSEIRRIIVSIANTPRQKKKLSEKNDFFNIVDGDIEESNIAMIGMGELFDTVIYDGNGNIEKMRGKFNELIKDAWEVLDEHLE